MARQQNSTRLAVSPSSSTTISATVPSSAAAGPAPASIICNGYQVYGPQFTVGTAYDNGTVALTVNGVTDSVPYGESQNADSGTLVSALISAINNDPNAFVTASPSGSAGGITLTSKEPGAAANYAYSLVDNYDSYDFSGPSFTSSPPSGALSGGTDAAVTQTPVYSYKIPSPGTPTTGYDANGNLLSYTDSVMGTWSFGYDPINRLIAASTSKTIEGGNLDYCWTYDQFGNRLGQFGSNAPFTAGSPTCQAAASANLTTNIATYNASNQMLTSNASGNLIQPVYDLSGDTTNDGKNSYLYDAEGRVCAAQNLLSGTITGYLYDAAGNRVAKGTLTTLSCDLTLNTQATPKPNNGFALTSQYLLGPSGEQMTELNATGAWVHTNVTADGTLFATFDNDGKGVHFFLDDWLGTRRVQTDYLGAVENTWTSLPYGDALTPSGTDDPTEQHFTGKERDAESGLDYFGARYFASGMGRWMSPDWSAQEEPVPYAKLDNPQSLNLYSYVLNNPLRLVDNDGHADVVAMCKDAKGACNVQVNQTVNIIDNKTGKTTSTISLQTNFTVTKDDKGNVSVSATSTAANVSGLKLSDGQLSMIADTNAHVQEAGATMGFGANTTQMMTALAGKETLWGTARPGEKSFAKDPWVNPLQWSGGHASATDFQGNVQGALNIFHSYGAANGNDPAATYGHYRSGGVPDKAEGANYGRWVSGIVESTKR